VPALIKHGAYYLDIKTLEGVDIGNDRRRLKRNYSIFYYLLGSKLQIPNLATMLEVIFESDFYRRSLEKDFGGSIALMMKLRQDPSLPWSFSLLHTLWHHRQDDIYDFELRAKVHMPLPFKLCLPLP